MSSRPLADVVILSRDISWTAVTAKAPCRRRLNDKYFKFSFPPRTNKCSHAGIHHWNATQSGAFLVECAILYLIKVLLVLSFAVFTTCFLQIEANQEQFAETINLSRGSDGSARKRSKWGTHLLKTDSENAFLCTCLQFTAFSLQEIHEVETSFRIRFLRESLGKRFRYGTYSNELDSETIFCELFCTLQEFLFRNFQNMIRSSFQWANRISERNVRNHFTNGAHNLNMGFTTALL